MSFQIIASTATFVLGCGFFSFFWLSNFGMLNEDNVGVTLHKKNVIETDRIERLSVAVPRVISIILTSQQRFTRAQQPTNE